MAAGKLLKNLPEWDSLPGLAEIANTTLLDGPGSLGDGRLEFPAPGGVGGCIYGEALAELLAIRAAEKNGIPVFFCPEPTGGLKIFLSQSATWGANFESSNDYVPFAVSDALATAISFENGKRPVLALPNVIATDIYSTEPTEEGVLLHQDALGKSGIGSFRELFGLRDNSKVVITHGRMTSGFRKTYGFGDVILKYPELGAVGDLDFLFFGSRPDETIVYVLRQCGCRVVKLLDTAKLTLPEANGKNRFLIENSSDPRFIAGEYTPLPENHGPIVACPFSLGTIANELGAVGYFLRPDPGAFELSYGEMLSSGIPVVTRIHAVEMAGNGKEKISITDGQMSLIPPAERGRAKVLEQMDEKTARELAGEIYTSLNLPASERALLAGRQASWISENFGYDSFARRARRLFYLVDSGDVSIPKPTGNCACITY
ncbi:MAG: hypothetical protein V1820_05735 [archaeon]